MPAIEAAINHAVTESVGSVGSVDTVTLAIPELCRDIALTGLGVVGLLFGFAVKKDLDEQKFIDQLAEKQKLIKQLETEQEQLQEDQGKEECHVCTSKKDQLEFSTIVPCGHSFCKTCLDQWIDRNRTCPTCRGNVERTVIARY